MWIIKHIFDGEYGCEERSPEEGPKVLVTLENEAGETKYLTAEDDWLTGQGLDIGSVWPE